MLPINIYSPQSLVALVIKDLTRLHSHSLFRNYHKRTARGEVPGFDEHFVYSSQFQCFRLTISLKNV